MTTDVDVRTAEDGVGILVAPSAIGLAWHTFNFSLTGAGLASTIKTCAQIESQADNIFFCVTGLLSTIIGVDGEVSAAKKFAQSKGYLGVAANAWQQSGLELIDLNVFGWDLDSLSATNMNSQKAHNHFFHVALCSLSAEEVGFVGYVPDLHKLARCGSIVHPFAPHRRQVECFADTKWNEGNVLSVQMYDQADHATFGYAFIGIFQDNSVDSGLQGPEPRGMPLTGGQHCSL